MENSNQHKGSVLVLGATGATGKHVIKHLLEQGESVKVIVRSSEKLTKDYADLSVTEATLLDLTDTEMEEHVKDCYAVISCLGHNMSFKGIYGQPRKLVTDAARKVCSAIGKVNKSGRVKYILMNTTGNRNRDLDEPIMVKEKVVIGILRGILPPHVDNEQAADYLRTEIGHNHDFIDWVTVRPDTLIDNDEVTEYTLHPSPIRSALFNAGKTSRINVGHFMSDLVTDDELFETWKGQMPVIYNTEVAN